MTRTTVLCLVTAGLLFAQKASNSGAEQDLLKIEKEMLAAALKGDSRPTERYVSETYVFTGPDGASQGKAETVQALKSGALKLQAASLDDAKVQVYGDSAVVTYSSNDKGTWKGNDITGVSRWTDVFVKQNGRWILVASHGSSVR